MNMTRRIGGTVYQVKVYCPKQDDDFEETILRLIAEAPAVTTKEAASHAARQAEQAFVG